MSLGGDGRTKHSINSSIKRLSDGTPSSKDFTIHNASTHVSIDGPSSEVIASFTFVVRTLARCGYLALGFGQRKFRRGTAGICFVACCLVRVSVGRSDGCLEEDSPIHAITKIQWILDASAVLMISVDKRVNEAHHHDPMLEASQEHLSDQVIDKMASPRKHSSLSPNGNNNIVQERAFVVMRERERERESRSFGHPTRHVCSSPSV